MRILLRNKIPFFSHLTVSWSLPVARIIFLKSSQIQSGGFTNLLCKSVKCLERIKSALQRKRHRRTGRGGEGGCSPPPNFGQLGFFGQHEKIWAKPVFKEVSMFLLLF